MRLMPLLAAALACVPAARTPAAEPAARAVAPGTFVDWAPRDGPLTLNAAGITAAVAAVPCEGDDAGPDCHRAALRVSAPGKAPITLMSAPGTAYRIAIGRLGTAGAAVMLDSYTGGAHCCHAFAIAVPQDDGFRAIPVAWQPPGSGKPQTMFDYGDIPFPADLSGDGTADLVLRDDRFLYAFASYAGSMAPPVVLSVRDGGTANVSADPAFVPLFRDAMRRARAHCTAKGAFERNGACAAYVADAARLGRFDEAWTVMLDAYDRDSTTGLDTCTADYVNGDCPAGHEKQFADFPQALRAFLDRTGYIAPQ